MDLPKIRFQLSKSDVDWHKAFVNTSAFERATDAALLEIAYASKDAGYYLEGAKAFVKAFVALSETQSVSEAPKRQEVIYP